MHADPSKEADAKRPGKPRKYKGRPQDQQPAEVVSGAIAGDAPIAGHYWIDWNYRLDAMTGEPDDRASVPSGELLTMRKTLSFAAVHFLTAFAIGYLMTGSVWVGGALALVEPACNTVAFHFHERVWMRLEARRGRTRSGHLAAPGLG